MQVESIQTARERKEAPPSWRIFCWFADQLPALSEREIRFMVVLLRHAKFASGTAFLNWSTIAREAGMSKATVARAQADLERRGLISHEKRWGGPRRRSNLYRLHANRHASHG